jgi:hypothetical protein
MECRRTPTRNIHNRAVKLASLWVTPKRPMLEPTIVKITVDTTANDTARAVPLKRSPPLVLAHGQRQEDHAKRKAKEREVAHDVVDGADQRSFCADIYREGARQQLRDAVEAKEKSPT